MVTPCAWYHSIVIPWYIMVLYHQGSDQMETVTLLYHGTLFVPWTVALSLQWHSVGALASTTVPLLVR